MRIRGGFVYDVARGPALGLKHSAAPPHPRGENETRAFAYEPVETPYKQIQSSKTPRCRCAQTFRSEPRCKIRKKNRGPSPAPLFDRRPPLSLSNRRHHRISKLDSTAPPLPSQPHNPRAECRISPCPLSPSTGHSTTTHPVDGRLAWCLPIFFAP